MIKPQSCATQTFLTVTSPLDLSTSTSAVTATTELDRALTATPRPAAILPLEAGAGAGRACQFASLAPAVRASVARLFFEAERMRECRPSTRPAAAQSYMKESLA